MHQYNTDDWFRLGDKGFSNQYWKLASHSQLSISAMQTVMNARNFFCPDRHPKARKLELFHRMQRGLLSYESCSDVELRTFLKDRALLPQSPTSRTADMVAILERADGEQKFESFMDLPAELREHIYTLHFEDVGAALPSLPQQPPITRTCQKVRTESLSLFYSVCTFPIRVLYSHTSRTEARFLTSTNTFVYHTSPDALSRIRAIHITVTGWCPYRGALRLAETEWTITLGGEAGTVELVKTSAEGMALGNELDKYEGWVNMVTAKLANTVNEICDRGVKPAFLAADIHGLRDAFSKVRGYGY